MQQIVYKNDGSIPVQDILCTTYQMRNFYMQMRDGFFTNLDVMNYIQHFKAVQMMNKDDVVLDVCCGRGLLLPMMRYYAKNIKEYIGVDIEPKNIQSKYKNICNNKKINPDTHYPFKTKWVISNVADMSKKIKTKVSFIVYTSSIEHMHKDHGEQSLAECAKLLQKGGKMLISCPNTPEGQDGYDTRYKAHVYEWKLKELKKALKENGFKVEKEFGLVGKKNDLNKLFKEIPDPISKFFEPIFDYLPNEFFTSFMFIPFPQLATEVLLIVKKI